MATIVSLVGLPGGGKSTVGRHLARRLGADFVDTDAVIERRLGCSIREFFDREGEAAFRDEEERVLAELVAQHRGVMATLLHDTTTCVYLRASPDELFRRLRHDTQRPLLQVRNPLARLRELHVQRDPLYRQAAHFVLETGRPSVPTLVNMVLMQLELGGALPLAEPPTLAAPPPTHPPPAAEAAP
ncbi:MAG: shikimate kinase [Ideonella sp.]|nr:shikimate kinase [Ideonella sp.]